MEQVACAGDDSAPVGGDEAGDSQAALMVPVPGRFLSPGQIVFRDFFITFGPSGTIVTISGSKDAEQV